ncbi:putative ferric-chelate reductase 1 isoform X2 [Pecten maximus]|uniref:putative ferric-chelate reductase 1 isoform X2 n=1 Tax=Pecten maximus TaxID=6579 RepID=UPI0014581D6E|nr:putative ferric-chelate reductase 1 isoform X2 [Pecten maximus]
MYSMYACSSQMSWTKLVCILIAGVYIQLTDGVIPPDPGCGSTKVCWPSECPVGGCVGFLVSWWNTDLDYLRFQMKVEFVTQGDHYIALGFSGNNRMPDSSIVMCLSDANVQLGYTSGRTYVPGTDLYGIRNTSVVIENNITTCTFDRIKNPVRNAAQLRYLSNPFFLLRAWGLATNGVPSYHGTTRGVSPNEYSYPTPTAAGHTVLPFTTTLGASLMVVSLFYI